MEVQEVRFGENTVCNLCGHLCSLEDLDGKVHEHHAGLQNVSVSGGYHSTAGNGFGALDDTETYTFSLCELCLDWLFSQFVVPIQVTHYMGDPEEPEPFRPADQRVHEDEWRRFKAEYFALRAARAKDRGVK